MRKNELGEVRRSQSITTYGPGAIVDFRIGGHRGAPVSVVAGGIDAWDDRASSPGLAHPQTTFEPRLQKRLKVDGFRLPPVIAGDPDNNGRDTLLGVRFPRWLQCPRCGRISPDDNQHWLSNPGDARRWCGSCTGNNNNAKFRVYVVPVRFVAACRNGHLEDFPWFRWSHETFTEHIPILFLRQDKGSSLASLTISCEADGCDQNPTSMANCFGQGALRTKCNGRRPWLGDSEQCDEDLRAVQRGASNLYFPIIESALDIPPWADAVQKRLGVYWSKVANQPDPIARKSIIELLNLHEQLGVTLAQAEKLITERMNVLDQDPGILEAEYRHFVSTVPPELRFSESFKIRHREVPPTLKPAIGVIAQASRLREVRVLTGFTRLEPWDGSEDVSRIAPITSEPDPDWLPGIQILGEGIFIGMDVAELEQWESKTEVVDRVEALKARIPADRSVDTSRYIPRFIALHTLSHVVMTELANECGYSLASLSERLYSSSDEMAGVLIYTGTPDSEGTLGGLVKQGEPARLASIVRNALRNSMWCANDPLCIDGTTSMSDILNLGACHACSFLPETSCSHFNHGLDRGLLVGSPSNPGLGFFNPLIGNGTS